MITTRRGARITGVVALVLVNLFLGATVWTFVFATRTTARIDHCSHGRHVTCHGVWTEDARRGSGAVQGASRSDIGHDVPVRLGPLGAFEDDAASATLLIAIPVVIDLGVAVLALRITGRIGAGRRARTAVDRAAGGGAWVVRTDAGVGYAADGSVVAPLDGDVVRGPLGEQRFTVATPSSTVVGVSALDGAPIGEVSHRAGDTLWLLTRADGTPLGRMDARADGFVSGRGFDIIDPAGAQVGTLRGKGLDEVVVVLAAEVGEPMRSLMLGFALAAPRLADLPG